MAAFDPDAFLSGAAAPAPKAKPAGFDPDAFLAAGEPSEPEKPQVSKLESLGRGVLQGATLGFADEIWAALKAGGVSGKTYEMERDRTRRENQAAQDANPGSYIAGEVGGGIASAFVPGLGVAKGAGAVGNAVKAAGLGAVSGVGSSEAGDLGGVAKDAAVGGIAGGVLGYGAAKLVGGAPDRAAARVVDDITKKATATQRDRIAVKADEVANLVLDDKGLRKAANKPAKLIEQVDERLDALGAANAERYAKVDELGGMRLGDLTGKLQEVRDKFAKSPGTLPVADEIDGALKNLSRSWGDDGARLIPAREVRGYLTNLQKIGFSGSALNPTAAKEAKREVAAAVGSALDEHLDAASGAFPALATVARDIKADNRKTQVLLRIREAAEYKDVRSRTGATGLRDIASGALDAGLLLTQNVPGFLAKQGYKHVGVPAARSLDYGVARLVRAAKDGSTAAQLAQMALELGVPAAMAQKIAAAYSPRE
jgi:hypothetical protein